MLAAPLFMSNDLRTISHEAREILQNRWVIGINQDRLGKQGKRFVNKDSVQVGSRRVVCRYRKPGLSLTFSRLATRRAGAGS
ncbi:MAG: hypothetical protein AAFO91_11180 [Bacteroidota bacterium]